MDESQWFDFLLGICFPFCTKEDEIVFFRDIRQMKNYVRYYFAFFWTWQTITSMTDLTRISINLFYIWERCLYVLGVFWRRRIFLYFEVLSFIFNVTRMLFILNDFWNLQRFLWQKKRMLKTFQMKTKKKQKQISISRKLADHNI